MKQMLRISVRFLDDRYHGRVDCGRSAEWPPSPMRLFQAIVAGGSIGGSLPQTLQRGLEWLERQSPPTIIAPIALETGGYSTYIPNPDLGGPGQKPSATTKRVAPVVMNGE